MTQYRKFRRILREKYLAKDRRKKKRKKEDTFIFENKEREKMYIPGSVSAKNVSVRNS